ncbi:NAD dependent epimerase/dehydratase, partial [Diplocarpon mali]
TEYVQKWIDIQDDGANEELIERNLRDLTAGIGDMLHSGPGELVEERPGVDGEHGTVVARAGVSAHAYAEAVRKVARHDWREAGKRLLEFHESYIRRVVPPERLFFFNVKDSWEPLCRILSCPVPNEPFPRANDGQAMQGFFENMLKAAVVRWMQIFVVGGACIAMGVWGAERSLCINCRI